MNSPEFFNGLDYFCFVVIFFSLFVGFFRGFTKDFLGTFSWIGSSFVASVLAPYFLPTVQEHISNAFLAKCASLTIVYIVSLLVMKVIINTLSSSVKATILSSVDRLLGCIFGFARGGGILVCIPIIALLFGFDQNKYDFVKESKVAPMLLKLAEYLMPRFSEFTGIKPIKSPKNQKPKTTSTDFSRVPIKKKENKEDKMKVVINPNVKTINTAEVTTVNSERSIIEKMKDYIADMFAKRYVEQEFEPITDNSKYIETPRIQIKDNVKVVDHTVRKKKVDKYKNVRPKYGIMNLLDAKRKRMKDLRHKQKKQEFRKMVDKEEM